MLQTTALSNDQSVIMRANRLPVTCLAVTGCSYSLPTTTTSADKSPVTTTTSTSIDNGNGFKKVRSVIRQVLVVSPQSSVYYISSIFCSLNCSSLFRLIIHVCCCYLRLLYQANLSAVNQKIYQVHLEGKQT